MPCLNYFHDELYLEGVRLTSIADQFGTPCYVYSRAELEKNWQSFELAFRTISHRTCYAVKANGNIAILQVLAKLNAHFDIVSGGELKRVLAAGGNPAQIIFSGIGKSEEDIEQAILHDIYCFNVESIPELERLQSIATRLGKQVQIALRINPDVNPETHAHISTGLKENKFGIECHQIEFICQQLAKMPALKLIGIACHIGSQILTLSPFKLAMQKLIQLYQEIVKNGFSLTCINLGGGLGVTYRDEQPPTFTDYAALVKKMFNDLPVEIILEPGRAISATAGILLTRIEYLKPTTNTHFAIMDAGMNDFMRPALYDAWQTILPVRLRAGDKQRYDIVGPVCESADYLGKGRMLSLMPHDLLAIDAAGAYGFSMSSNYNARNRVAEILVEGQTVHLIRRRENIEDMLSLESLIAE